MTYTSQYPPAQNGTYVKATYTNTNYDFQPFYTTNPVKSVIGDWIGNAWYNNNYFGDPLPPMRFHIDLGSAKTIKRVYYENGHVFGTQTSGGVQNVVIQGSNSPTAFAELNPAINTDWTDILTTAFDEHVAADTVDPKFLLLPNSTPYRYYAFKFLDNWGDPNGLQSVRRLVLQTQNEVFFTSHVPVLDAAHVKSNYTPVNVNPSFELPNGFDSTQPVTGNWYDCRGTTYVNPWNNARINIDLDSPIAITRLYFENLWNGVNTDAGNGVKNFIIQASNSPTSFNNTTYGDDTGWTTIPTDISQLQQHIMSDVSDPQYVQLTNSTAYRYWSLKIVDNDQGAWYVGFRRMELQTADVPRKFFGVKG
jgi:hypothetical protein